LISGLEEEALRLLVHGREITVQRQTMAAVRPRRPAARGHEELYTARDFAGKSGKFEYVRVQGSNPPRGCGGIPIQGERPTAEFVNGSSAWNLNAQGQPVAQPGAAADRQHLMLTGPVGCPRTTKLYDRTDDEITLDEVERIAI
jgi:hypothetical protein